MSHLIFIDDLILFIEAYLYGIQTIQTILKFSLKSIGKISYF